MRGHDGASVEVFVAGEPWTSVSSLAEAGADDKVYALNLEDGTLVFGDGVHGKTPPKGADVTVSYHSGGGTAGNVGVSISARWPPERRTYRIAVGHRGFEIRAVKT